MRSPVRHVVLLALALATGACAHRSSATDPDGPRPRMSYRADLITANEIEAKSWSNIYEMVAELRANWLNVRGPDTLYGEPGHVMALLDEQRLGDVTMLQTMPVMNVAYVQYFDPTAAAARWGLGYNHGAIVVSTRERR